MKLNAFITGGGGDVSSGIIDCLRRADLDIDIFIGSSTLEIPEKYLGEKVIELPLVEDESYISTLTKSLKNLDIDLFIPAIDSEISKVAERKDEIEKNGSVKVCVCNIEMAKIFSDKYETYVFLKKNGFPVPRTELLDSRTLEFFLKAVDFPFIAKPRSGGGSLGVIEVTNSENLQAIIDLPGYVIQEKLSTSIGEYTAGFYLGIDLEVKGLCVLERILRKGSTMYAERIFNSEIEEQLERLIVMMNISHGNIQFTIENGLVVPFEINPRFSGSTYIQREAFNGPEHYVRERILGQRIEKQKNSIPIRAVRRSNIEFLESQI